MALAGLLFYAVNKWVGALLASAIVSVYYPMYDVVSAMAMLQWMLVGAWYFLCYKVKDSDRVLDAICVVALVHYGFSVLQWRQIDPVYKVPVSVATCGMMTNPNEAAALAAIAIPAFCRMSYPYLVARNTVYALPVPWVLGVPLMLHSLVLSQSFGAAMALCAGGVWWCWKKGYRLPILFLLVALLAYLLVDKPETQGVRFAAWTVAAWIVSKLPLFGVGLGHWPSTFPVIPHPTAGIPLYFDSAHNDYVQFVYEHGLKGLPLLIGFIATLLWRANKFFDIDNVQRLNAAVVICLVSASYHWLFQNGTTAPIAVAYLAMLDKETMMVQA